MSLFHSDPFAVAGYEYALGIGQLASITITNELELMAFNAGITQANDKYNLNVDKFLYLGTITLSFNTSATDKEIQTGVYHD